MCGRPLWHQAPHGVPEMWRSFARTRNWHSAEPWRTGRLAKAQCEFVAHREPPAFTPTVCASCMCVCVCVCVYVCMCVCMYVCMCVCICMCEYVCVCMYACVCCMCVCTSRRHIHAHTRAHFVDICHQFPRCSVLPYSQLRGTIPAGIGSATKIAGMYVVNM